METNTTFSDNWSERPTVETDVSQLQATSDYAQGHRDGFSCGVAVGRGGFWTGVALGAWGTAVIAVVAAVL